VSVSGATKVYSDLRLFSSEGASDSIRSERKKKTQNGGHFPSSAFHV